MASVRDFEERYHVKFITGKLFVDLWVDEEYSDKYYVSLDFNIIDSFFAKSDEDAIKIFEERSERYG